MKKNKLTAEDVDEQFDNGKALTDFFTEELDPETYQPKKNCLVRKIDTSDNTDFEFILSTNIKTLIKIIGVAEGSLRDNKTSPWKKGYFCFYEHNGATKKAEINQDLYKALHLVFTNLGDNHEYGFDRERDYLDDTVFTND